MSKHPINKKLLLGSALAGLMVAAPSLSVTTSGEGKFFQTAELNVGYRLAAAAHHEKGDMKKEGAKEEKKDEAKKDEKKNKKDGKHGSCGAGSCGGDKKGDKSGSCGAGACG